VSGAVRVTFSNSGAFSNDSKDYTDITDDISAYSAELRKLIPETMQGFSGMAKAALQTKALDEKTKEMIALALALPPIAMVVWFPCQGVGAARRDARGSRGSFGYDRLYGEGHR